MKLSSSRWAVSRAVILILLAVPLTDLLYGLTSPPPSYVLAVDDSPSMTRRHRGYAEIVKTRWEAEPPPEGFIVPVSGEDGEQPGLSSTMAAASSLFGEYGNKRMLFVSDGLAPAAGIDLPLQTMRDRGISVFALALPPPSIQAGAVSLHGPDRAWLSEPFTIRGVVSSTAASPVHVTLYRDGLPLRTSRVIVDEWGRGSVEYIQESDRVGTVSYSLAVDGQPYPPVFTAVHIASAPRVRYIVEDPETALGLVAIFRRAGIELNVSRMADLPYETDGFAEDDVFVLDDPSGTDLNGPLAEKLISAVGTEGKGLIVIGGRKGLGSEEMRHSRLGAILPVVSGYTSPPPPPPVSLVIAMDTSFSMHGRGRGKKIFHSDEPRKIDVAREAAKEVVKIVRPQDRLGLIGNSTDLFWIHELGPTGDRTRLVENIDSIKPRGDGLNFYSIVYESYQRLLRDDAPIRHILVLGDSEDIDEYEIFGRGHSYDLLREMARNGVTLSVIALGHPTDKDVPFLRTASLLGKGDFYQVSNINALPQYFVSDYRKLSSQQFLEAEILPRMGDSTPLMHGVNPVLPVLGGISLVTPREDAIVPVRTHTGVPLVTTGIYGKGRTAVFASDNGYRWAKGWTSWASAGTFWTQLLFAVARDPESLYHSAALAVDRAEKRFTYRIRSADGSLPTWPRLWLHYRGGDRPPLPLVRSGLSEYMHIGELPETGLYRVAVTEDEEGTRVLYETQIFVPPTIESLPVGENRPLLDRIVTATGGEWITDLNDMVVPPEKAPFGYNVLYTLAAGFGLLLLLLESFLKHYLRR